jgi:hypothetical protein
VELAARAQQLVGELAAVVTPRGAAGAIASAVVEAGLGLTQEVDVFVLSGLEGLPDADRESAELLAGTLADRGATVLVVSGGTEPVLVPASPRPTADQAPVPDVDGSVRTTR